jgi:hypothetical protein
VRRGSDRPSRSLASRASARGTHRSIDRVKVWIGRRADGVRNPIALRVSGGRSSE